MESGGPEHDGVTVVPCLVFSRVGTSSLSNFLMHVVQSVVVLWSSLKHWFASGNFAPTTFVQGTGER